MKPFSSILEAIAKALAHSVGLRVPRDRGRAGRASLPILCLLATLFCLSAKADEQLLWWMVEDDDSTVVDWYGTPSSITDIGATDARLRVDDANGTVAYLDFYMLNDDSPPVYERWTPGSDGAGIPVWAYADVTGYTAASYSFAIELGNYEDGEWVKTLASTDSVPYNNMQEHIGTWEGITPVVTSPWKPASYSVPEPSSGLLMLIGGALLALRRRRRT